MRDIELLTDLVNLMDKYDASDCAILAARLSEPDFLERLMQLLGVLGKQQILPEVKRARESEDRAYSRAQSREKKVAMQRQVALEMQVPVDEFPEDDEVFARHFQALKGYQAKGKVPESALRDDEQIIK